MTFKGSRWVIARPGECRLKAEDLRQMAIKAREKWFERGHPGWSILEHFGNPAPSLAEMGWSGPMLTTLEPFVPGR